MPTLPKVRTRHSQVKWGRARQTTADGGAGQTALFAYNLHHEQHCYFNKIQFTLYTAAAQEAMTHRSRQLIRTK